MQIRPDELESIIKQIDTDQSGQVDFDEFLQVGCCWDFQAAALFMQHESSFLVWVWCCFNFYCQFLLSTTHTQVMARPQEMPYTRKDLLRAFEMFAKDGEPEGYINPEKLEEALVRAMIGKPKMKTVACQA